MKAVDNKGKLSEFKLVAQADGYRPGGQKWLKTSLEIIVTGLGQLLLYQIQMGNLVATESNPAVITATGHMKMI